MEQTVLSWCEPEAASLRKGFTQTEGTPLHVLSKAERLKLVSLQNALAGFRCFPQIDDEEPKTCSAGHQRAQARKGPDVTRRRRTFIRRLRHDKHPKDALPQ